MGAYVVKIEIAHWSWLLISMQAAVAYDIAALAAGDKGNTRTIITR